MRQTRALMFACVLAAALAACSGPDGTSQREAAPQQFASQQGQTAQPDTAPEDTREPDDPEQLEQYLYPILFSGATRQTWTDPTEIDAQSLVMMYGYAQVWNADIPESEMTFEDDVPWYYVEQDLLEEYVTGYFAVSTDHLRGARDYRADLQAYAYNMSGVGFSYDPQVLDAESVGGGRLVLHIDDGYGGSEHGGVASILTIQLQEDGGYRYLSNEYRGN